MFVNNNLMFFVNFLLLLGEISKCKHCNGIEIILLLTDKTPTLEQSAILTDGFISNIV